MGIGASLAAACLSIAVVAPLRAQSPGPSHPFIQSIFPRGGRQGTELEIAIEGRQLQGATQLRFSGAGVAARILSAAETKVTARVTIASNAALGRRDLRIFTPQGTFVQAFQVGALPEVLEKEPNNDWAAAPLLQLPVVVNGKIEAADYDCFRFRAEAGQTLVFDMNSSRVGTRFDGMLWLLGSDGSDLAVQDDFYFDKDPHLVYRFTKSGEYAIRLSGFRESGSNAAEYRLQIGQLPSLSHVFPAGARRGQTVVLAIAGANLDKAEAVVLDRLSTRAEILHKTPERLEVRLALPPDAEPGFYRLRVQAPGIDIPEPLVFVVSDMRELVLAGPPPAAPLDLHEPLVINGAIRQPKQADHFWIDVQAGQQLSIQVDGMSLGNFLDPALTIFDSAGNVEAYIDESAPNGFDKDPPNLDFHLNHRFEKAGRYRLEMRDAGLRGDESFVYRLRVGPPDPVFELTALTNQISVAPGDHATLPVRVRRLDGWDAPVKVWLEGLPARVESQSMIAEPVNTRFRGTFGEDFFFDGTNLDLPLEAHQGAPAGAFPVRVRARGTCHGRTVEKSAIVFYPWQQTGYLRGRAEDQDLLLTLLPGGK